MQAGQTDMIQHDVSAIGSCGVVCPSPSACGGQFGSARSSQKVPVDFSTGAVQKQGPITAGVFDGFGASV